MPMSNGRVVKELPAPCDKGVQQLGIGTIKTPCTNIEPRNASPDGVWGTHLNISSLESDMHEENERKND